MTLDRLLDEILKACKQEPSSIPWTHRPGPMSMYTRPEQACRTPERVHQELIRRDLEELIQTYVKEQVEAAVGLQTLSMEQRNAATA